MAVGRVEAVATYCRAIKEEKLMLAPNGDCLLEMTAYLLLCPYVQSGSLLDFGPLINK